MLKLEKFIDKNKRKTDKIFKILFNYILFDLFSKLYIVNQFLFIIMTFLLIILM